MEFYTKYEHTVIFASVKYIGCAAIAYPNLLVFYFVWSPGMSKRLKLSGADYHRLKGNGEENSTKYRGSIDP